MLDHRVAVEIAELPRDADQDLLRLHAALERDLALALVGFDAGQRRDEIGLPGLAAVLAVGDRFEAGRFLLPDQGFDLAILDRLQLLGRDLAAFALGAGLLQSAGAQQAADVIGAEGRIGALHCSSLSTGSDAKWAAARWNT